MVNHAGGCSRNRVKSSEAFSWHSFLHHRLTACSGRGSSGGGARESFGGSGVIVLADNRRLAAQGTGHRRLARLEGIHHIHLKGQS